MDNCWWLKKFHYPGHPPKKGDANAKRSFVWFEANQSSFHSFSLNYLEKKGCNELPGRKKRLLLSLDTFTLRPRNGGMRPLRLWQNSWSHGMCRNPTDPQFFWIWKGSFHKAVKPYMSANIFSKNLCNQTFTKPLSLWWQPLSMIPLTWSVKDLKCWILWSSTPRHDDTWSFGLHRRKWNNCNGHGNIELPKSVKYLWILSNFIEVMSQQFDTLHFEACSLVIQAMEPWTFCKWSFFLEKRMIFNFRCSISSHKTLVVDLPYLPLPHENHRKVV